MEIKVEMMSRADIPRREGRKLGQAALIIKQLEGKGVEEAVKVTCKNPKEANSLAASLVSTRKRKNLAIGISRIDRIIYVYKTEIIIGGNSAH